MRIAQKIRHALERARAFLRNRDANVAMIFAISIIPVTIAAGAGLDLTRAMIVKSNLSEALDAAALSVASTSGLTTAQMQTQAQNYFNANYKADANYGTPALVTVTPGTQQVTVSTSVPMPTTLMGVAGISTVNVTASSTVVWGQTKLWVGLVLDNTGSMCQSDTNTNASSPCLNPASNTKIASLKSATHTLLGILQGAAATAGDVQVAIVPFVKDVNVGTANSGATWIDWTSWDAVNGTCEVSSKTSQSSCTGTSGTWIWTGGTCTIASQTTNSGCTSNHGTWTAGSCTISTISSQGTCTTTHGTWSTFSSKCNIAGYTTKTTCQAAYGAWTPASCDISGISSQSTCQNTYGVWTWTTGNCNLAGYTTQTTCQNGKAVWTPNSHTTWNGCVEDRGNSSGPDTTNNYDAMSTAPTTATASKFLAEQYSSCPQSILPLGYDWTALSNKVDAMVADGSTNQPIGLVWGWHALTNSDPLNAGSLPANTSRYIIILSDGLNTEDRWYGDGVHQSTSVDSRMTAVCTNAKAAGIVIYALFVDIGGTQGNSSVMQSCATDSSKYWDLTSASQISAAFTAIGQQITNLRVSQ
jgi:Flp pilus assembly protein TadG